MFIGLPLTNKHFKELNPLEAGYQQCTSGYSFGPFIREHFLLHYVEKGKGTFTCPTGTFSVKKGQIFVIKPGEVTTYTADSSDPWEYIWIGFNGRLAEKFNELAPVVSFEHTSFSEIKNLPLSSSTKEEFLCARIFDIYHELFDSGAESVSYVKQIKNYLNINYMKKISIAEIAKLIGLDRSYLTRIFRDREGKSPQEYLIELRLTKAKSFLQKGFNISETASMCGYSDVFSFSKSFKKHFGSSPTEYLAALKKSKNDI